MESTEVVLLDTNVPMYASGIEHPYQEPCLWLLERVLAGDVMATTDAEVDQEILHRYLSTGMGHKARQVSEDFQTLVPSVLPVTIYDVERSRKLSFENPELPARDLIHVAVMLNQGITVIVSADRHFDQVAEIRRIDPLHLARATSS